MKSTALIAAVALVSAAFCVGANAQTGRPSTEEAPAAPVAVVQGDAQVGSYARYLMLSGMSRDEAIVQAAPFDRPAPRPFVQRFAFAHARATTTGAANAATVQQ
jgi:hypothetical protein